MRTIYEKMVNEAMGAQRADVSILLEKRGTDFHVKDGKPYVDAVNAMTVGNGQSKAVTDVMENSLRQNIDKFESTHQVLAAAPVRACKSCASASCVDFRHQYCEYRNAV